MKPIVLLALAVTALSLAGCSMNVDGPTKSSPSDREPTLEQALADINDTIVDTQRMAQTGKERFANNDTRLADIRRAYEQVSDDGDKYTATLADYVELNKWDAAGIKQRANVLQQSATSLSVAVGDSSASKDIASTIADVLIKTATGLYNAYKDRQEAERKKVAVLVRTKVWKAWKDIGQ